MATNAEQFQQHVKSNPGVYRAAIAKGVITEDDLKIAGNSGGNYSYADQDAALQRINDAFGEYAKEYPDHEQLQKFVSGIPQIQKFTPNPEDWQKYNQEQLGRLAESMKFNWRNKDDRSQMMKQLMDAQILKDKKKIYQDYKKENPVAAFINENIIAPNVSNRMSKGEDITNTDIALDAANVGTYLFPGAGAAASKAGKAAMFAADAALQGGVGVASDLNQGNELGPHNIIMPMMGAGAGTVTDLVPRMGKMAVDVATGGFGGRVGKPVGDVAEGWITKVFGDEVDVAKQALSKQAKEAEKTTRVAKNATESEVKELMDKNVPLTPNAQARTDAKWKEIYANDPEKWKLDKANMSKTAEGRARYDRLMSDPNFAKVVTYTAPEGAARVGREAARGTSRQAGKGIMITQANKERSKNAKPSLEQVFASPEMQDYIRLKKRGYHPTIPDEFKEYKDQVDSLIYDYHRNLRWAE